MRSFVPWVLVVAHNSHFSIYRNLRAHLLASVSFKPEDWNALVENAEAGVVQN